LELHGRRLLQALVAILCLADLMLRLSGGAAIKERLNMNVLFMHNHGVNVTIVWALTVEMLSILLESFASM